jgi:hypothetical protein
MKADGCSDHAISADISVTSLTTDTTWPISMPIADLVGGHRALRGHRTLMLRTSLEFAALSANKLLQFF